MNIRRKLRDGNITIEKTKFFFDGRCCILAHEQKFDMMKSLYIISLFIIVAAVNVYSKEIGFPPIQNFPYRQYHAAPENWACVQGKDGLMYFGNEDGVLEYDGSMWTVIPLRDNRPVRSLAQDSTGKLFIGGVNDFGFLSVTSSGSKVFTSLRPLIPDSTLTFQEVWKTYVIGNAVYFHSDQYIFKYENNRIVIIHVQAFQDYSFSVNGRLFVYQRDIGLSEIKDTVVIVVQGGEFYSKKRIRTIIPLQNEQMVIGTENGLYFYNGKSSVKFNTDADSLFLSSAIFDGVLLSDSTFAMATMGNGIFVLDVKGKLLFHIKKKNGILSDLAFAMCTDYEHGIWIAQLGGGISRIDYGSPVVLFDQQLGFDKYIFSAIRDQKNTFFLGTENGLYEFDQNAGILKQRGLYSEDVQYFYQFNGGILLGCRDGTFFYINGISKKISSAYSVYFLSSKFNNNFIFACDYGVRLLEMKNNMWIDHGVIAGISESIYRCYENADGTLWLFTYTDGIIHVGNEFRNSTQIQNTKTERYNTQNGLPALAQNSPAIIDGKLYFSTIRGLYSFHPNSRQFIFDSAVHARFDPPLQQIPSVFSEEIGGSIFIVSQAKQKNTEFGYYQKDSFGIYHKQGSAFGLLNTMNAQLVLRDGKDITWFSSDNILLQYNSTKELKQVSHFFTRISSVNIQDTIFFPGISESQKQQGIEHIAYSHNTIRFDYSLQSYSGEKQFQYRLDGLDTTWSQWNSNHFKEYSLLPPGEYRFRVRGMNVNGVIGTEASFGFNILPLWWQTLWFRFILFLLIIIAIYKIGNHFTLRKLAAVKAEEAKRKEFSRQLIESQEKERKRISSELHDSLGQNLLIIKNMLDINIAQAPPKKEILGQMKEISEIASRSIEETRTIASNLHPYQLNRMGLVKAINAMIRSIEQSSTLRVSHHIETITTPISKEIEAHLYRIVQESINNVVKHSGATALSLVLKNNPNEIQISIMDDGNGFDISSIEQTSVVSPIGGLGLFSLKERARIIGAVLNIHSTSGKGTTVEVILPTGTTV